jgi:hypothetical protein
LKPLDDSWRMFKFANWLLAAGGLLLIAADLVSLAVDKRAPLPGCPLAGPPYSYPVETNWRCAPARKDESTK